MKTRTRRKIEPLVYHGSTELGQATGMTSKHTHAKWRKAGLKYFVTDDGTFLYRPSDVIAFFERQFTPQQVKKSLKE